MINKVYNVGLDIGSTTVKLVVLDEDEIIYKKYVRHLSDVKNTVLNVLNEIKSILYSRCITINMTGSGAFDIAQNLKVDFVQEVIACMNAVEKLIPQTHVAIELGGEDAKITYFDKTVDQRMNGTCAGGTGSFIDQMAALLETDISGLNTLAKHYKNIYPVASRCGVFAKTDVQSLLNEGISKEDIAASILQAVANQTITALAQGRTIKGNVAFLGGPLYFIEELRNRFIETLNLSYDEVIIPQNSQYFVAIGCALNSRKSNIINGEELYNNIENINNRRFNINDNKIPLFNNIEEYNDFKKKHDKYKVRTADIKYYKGNAFLGIDAGSTTTKGALITDNGELLSYQYSSNRGKPLESVIESLKNIYKYINQDIKIVNSCVTGYGENLVKNALKIDIGEVETIAHYKAAQFFQPEVDCVLDIGGQDMKCLKIQNGVISSVILNEACSSGCGSFIQTFADSLKIGIRKFVNYAINSKTPVNLGTRCTVFMNSSVKQAQKQGSNIEDIAAGICTSVIKNALYKVIRIKNASELGDKVVVQGGTFYNDAVLRALELELGKDVIRPDIAGIMGAFGCALIAKERYVNGHNTNIVGMDYLENFKNEILNERCGLCGNNCLLTINTFQDGSKFITGNRCERPTNLDKKLNYIPNIYRYKLKRLFQYKSLKENEAKRGTIGIPRVLNMYEDYPFWFTLFNNLGYKVVLSSISSKKIYELGMDTIPSESVCYPAKLVHGHIVDLINRNITKIFYPSIALNIKENKSAINNYNCPVVTSYSENIKLNMDILSEKNIEFINPFLSLNDRNKLIKRLVKELSRENISETEMKKAVELAYKELENYKQDLRNKGEEILNYLKTNNLKGLVLSGRPYHIDPEINHGMPELINSLGYAVLSEDCISHLGENVAELRVVDQWTYHSRLYKAANFVGQSNNLEMIQLNSFGCGLDAVTTDQVKEILEKEGKIYTLIKIDDISNLGAVKIRIRSLSAAIKDREEKILKINEVALTQETKKEERVFFNKDMRNTHTILIPQMSDTHFRFVESAFNSEGYNTVHLRDTDKDIIEEGLKYVNNDSCYPSVIVVGQIMAAIKSKKYDLNNTAIIMSQTGGGCRASNYIAMIRKALKDEGLDNIPVISFNMSGMEKNPGFKLTLPILNKVSKSIIYGDLLTKVLLRVRPYEKEKGSADKLFEYWVEKIKRSLVNESKNIFKDNIYNIVKDFDNIPINENVIKPKVGIVGEILVKYHDTGNNYLVKSLEEEGGEVVVPDLMNFALYSAYNNILKHKYLSSNTIQSLGSNIFINFVSNYRKYMQDALTKSNRFEPVVSINNLANKAQKYISLGNQTGEGWLLTAEMVELINSEVNNIVCVQPFGCLPNHIVGKGIIKKLKEDYPLSNIAPIDYDPGASEVNQLNRIRLMMSVARKNLEKRP